MLSLFILIKEAFKLSFPIIILIFFIFLQYMPNQVSLMHYVITKEIKLSVLLLIRFKNRFYILFQHYAEINHE